MAIQDFGNSAGQAPTFDWDEANIAHIAEHDVLPAEAEEVITGNPLDRDYVIRNGELRIRQVGATWGGRILAVISTYRGGRTRVITAYPASRILRAAYLTYKEPRDDGKGKSGSS